MKRPRPRPASRARRALRIVRRLCAFVLAVFLMQTTVAWAFPCDCLTDDCGESGSDHDEKKSCPCPIDCGPCCAGAVMPAMPSLVDGLVLPAPISAEIAGSVPDRAPPPAACFEILHVPRPLRA